MKYQFSPRTKIGTYIVLIASIIAVASFFLPWTSVGLILSSTSASPVASFYPLITKSGFETASTGISDKYSSFSWVYFITPITALLCLAFSLLHILKKLPALHVGMFQIILAILGLLPFVLMSIELHTVNIIPPLLTITRYGVWLSVLGLFGIIVGSVAQLLKCK